MIEIIKNPVIIGLTIGIIVYLYLKWEQSKHPEEKDKRKDSLLLLPLGIGIASWFIAHNYYENYDFTNIEDITNEIITVVSTPINNENIQMSSYHVLKKGVSIPNKFEIPDIMIDDF